MQSHEPGGVEYAEPVTLASSRSRAGRARPEVRPWEGPGRVLLRWTCLGASTLMALVLVTAVLGEEPGADTPQEAVARLLGGIADLDGAAIVASVAPAEVADVQGTEEAYTALGERVLRVGEVPPVEVDRVLLAAEGQLNGTLDRQALAILAAVDLELDGLELSAERVDARTVVVSLVGGTLALSVDPARLPGDAVIDAGSSGPVGYDMELAEGWQRDGRPIEASLVTVEVDGRWFVSLEASADDLLGAR